VKLAFGPSHVTDVIVTPTSCSFTKVSFTNFALGALVNDLIRKYPIGHFQLPSTATIINKRASVAQSILSSVMPLPKSTYPQLFPAIKSISFFMAISSSS
jgi:hypothetical protein